MKATYGNLSVWLRTMRYEQLRYKKLIAIREILSLELTLELVSEN